MKTPKFILSAFILLALGIINLQAQDSTPSSGGNGSGSGGSISYSIGQLVNNTYSNSNGSLAQGVQHPFEITELSGLEQIEGISLCCSIYPNPSIDNLTLKIEGNYADIVQYSAFLYNQNGKLISSKTVTENETTFSMKNYIAGSYLLKIKKKNSTSSTKEIKSFKIIKN